LTQVSRGAGKSAEVRNPRAPILCEHHPSLRDHARVLPDIQTLVAPGGHVVLIDIVDPGQWTSREWHIEEAFRDALDSYRNRSRNHAAAADVVRLRLHPAWLAHVTTNIPLTRQLFHDTYGAVFPGAEFTDDVNRVVAALRWENPGKPPASEQSDD
jgi:hypothetical protein